jgi:hypothetical protein
LAIFAFVGEPHRRIHLEHKTALPRGKAIPPGRAVILRGSHLVAEIGPAHRRTGADLRAVLEGTTPPDESFAGDISAALAMVTSEVPDPWADA